MSVSKDAKQAGGGKPAKGDKNPTYYFSKRSHEAVKKTETPKPNKKVTPGVS